MNWMPITLGDWAIHCQKLLHIFDAMGHDLPTIIGADKSRITDMVHRHQPDYMPIGAAGMANMSEMSMEIPESTIRLTPRLPAQRRLRSFELALGPMAGQPSLSQP